MDTTWRQSNFFETKIDVVPDEVTLCDVLSACCHSSLTELGNLLD